MSFLKQYNGKIIVVSSKNCPSCKTLKERVEKDQIMKKNMVFKNVEDDEVAQMLSEVFNVMSVPSYFMVSVRRRKAVVCKLDKDMNLVEGCVEVETEK